jgi:RNA polymerase sigma-70 factor (ECF subfamily)
VDQACLGSAEDGPAPHMAHHQDMDEGLGQDEAVDGLLAEKPLLVGYARAIVGNRTVAEDLFQDLLILVMRKHAEIPNRQALSGWSRRALRFLSLKAVEKRSRERPAMDAELVDLIDATCAESGPSRSESYLEALTQCLERLPDRSRRLLAMRYEEEISGQEMAERLDRPINTVYVTLTRLHRILEECIRAHVRRADA